MCIDYRCIDYMCIDLLCMDLMCIEIVCIDFPECTNQTKSVDSFLPGVVVDGLLASINCQDGSTILITLPPMAIMTVFPTFWRLSVNCLLPHN